MPENQLFCDVAATSIRLTFALTNNPKKLICNKLGYSALGYKEFLEAAMDDAFCIVQQKCEAFIESLTELEKSVYHAGSQTIKSLSKKSSGSTECSQCCENCLFESIDMAFSILA